MVWGEGIPPHPLFASSLLPAEGGAAPLTERLLEALTRNLQAEAAWLEGKIQTFTADADPKTQNTPFLRKYWIEHSRHCQSRRAIASTGVLA